MSLFVLEYILGRINENQDLFIHVSYVKPPVTFDRRSFSLKVTYRIKEVQDLIRGEMPDDQ